MSDERDELEREPRYTREEVEEILRRAAERMHAEGGTAGLDERLAHEELVDAAREAGIDPRAVEEAVGEVAEQRRDRLAVQRWVAARRRRFASHLITWAVVNAGLFLVDLLSGGGWWFFWPLLGWGIFVALQGLRALRAPTPEQVQRVTRRERRRLEAERKREARRLEREARRDRDRAQRERRKRVERDFDRAVESGVTALMGVIANRIEAAARASHAGPLPDTEFNRYVARRKQGAPTEPGGAAVARGEVARVASGAGAPRVRVEERDDEGAGRDDDGDEVRERAAGSRRGGRVGR